MMTPIELQKLSKKISYLLRHDPEDLLMDKNGWVFVADLLDKLRIEYIHLVEIVETNDKKRFSFNTDGTKIRANQGHSIEIDLKLKPIKPPDILYHGTSQTSYDTIIKSGIKKMNRQHVHLSDDLDTAYKVGKRHSKYKEPIIIHIDAKKMHSDKIDFFKSDNGVWLAEFVHKKYFINT